MEARNTVTKTEAATYKKATFPVLEMSCAACAVSVESMLKTTPGVKDASVNYANQTAWVEYNASVAKPVDLRAAVQQIGYDLVVDADDPQSVQEQHQESQYNSLKKRTLFALLLSLPVVAIGMFFMDMPYGN